MNVHPSHLPTVIDVLEDEIAKLRERIRFHAINIEPYDSDRGDGSTWIGCDECLSAWPEGDPEAHGHDCIAALPHKSKAP